MQTFSALANSSNPGATVSCRSGNSYAADASGIIHGIAPQDVLDVEQAGCRIISLAPNPDWQAGRVYGLPLGATLTTLLTVLGTIYAYPFFVPNLSSLKSLTSSVTTGQVGGNVRMGLYTSHDGLPNVLVAGTDSGSQVATGTALAAVTGLLVPLPPGLYWAALQATASSTMPSVEALSPVATSVLPNQLGYDTAAHALAGASQFATGVTATGVTYGAMPATFPTTAAAAQNGATPAIAVGV